MPMSFPQTVSAPGGASYAPPLMSFSGFANWRPDDPAKVRQEELAKAFPNGLPTDPRTGQVDYAQVASTFAKFGDPGSALTVLQQQPAPLSPLLGGQQPQGGGAVATPVPAQGGGQPPSAMAPPGSVASQPLPPVSDTAAKIIQAESGGDPNAKNDKSTAAGLGQFTDRTWLESVKRYFPNLAQGRSDDQILSMRRIPQLAARVTEAFTADNMQGLKSAGLPVTPATTYLAHFAGLGGAIKVLQADPNTPVRQILRADAIKANPFLKDMTARDLELWAARKMEGPAMVAQQALPQGNQPGPNAPAAFADRFAPSGPNAPATFASRFTAGQTVAPTNQQPANVQVADASGNLPPSVAAISPAPQPQQNAPAAPQGGQGAPQPQPAPQQPPAAAAAPQPPQQPAQQPLVPMPALPQGYTDPQKAVSDLRLGAAQLAADPRRGSAQQAQAMNAWADRIEAATRPIPMRPGETLLNPQTAQPIYSAPSYFGGQVGQLVRLENSEREARGEPPMTAQEEISFIQGVRPPRNAPAMAVEAFKKDFQQQNGRQPSAEEITKFASDYARQQSYGRAAGTQGARVENAANEVVQLIPQAVEASRAYARMGGKFVALNKLFQAYDQGTSDPKYNDFVLANFSLVNAYTRAMNPQGIPRIQERLEQHALGILSTATSQQAYETQVRRLWKEVQASKTATAKTAEGVSPGNINAPVPGMDDTKASTPSGTTSGGLKWSVE